MRKHAHYFMYLLSRLPHLPNAKMRHGFRWSTDFCSQKIVSRYNVLKKKFTISAICQTCTPDDFARVLDTSTVDLQLIEKLKIAMG